MLSRRAFIGTGAASCLLLAGCGKAVKGGRPKLRSSITGRGESDLRLLFKASGLGREGSKYGIEDYLEIKYLCLGV